jgi:hypothetical protein
MKLGKKNCTKSIIQHEKSCADVAIQCGTIAFFYGHKFLPIRVGGNLLQPLKKNNKNYERKLLKNHIYFNPLIKIQEKTKSKKN